jgi:tRNA threonylcarbamoyladenosine biosynthesis protein TsaB
MDSAKLLLLDTCGVVGSVALADGECVIAVERLAERMASANLLDAVQVALERAGWNLRDVGAVGVVSGPGSFTGVRVGMAAAKGLCEALRIPMAAVSRLAVLADAAAATAGVAVMDAGRGELYVRDVATGVESLRRVEDVRAGEAVGESSLLNKLPGMRVVEMTAADAWGAVLRGLRAGGTDVALAEANYVRGEAEIYARKPAAV